MRVLDLFSGIGGFSLGLERAGMETVAFCEIEKFPQKVLRKHWPNVPIYEDVTELTYERLRADGINGIDVICGGFPCQDLSVAGKQAGIDAERSGLWSELARLISEIRPRYAIVENVTALLSGDNGRWFGRVLGDLAEIGYDAEWHCIPASELGANHHRDRVWIIAYPNNNGSSKLRVEKNGTGGKRRKAEKIKQSERSGKTEILGNPKVLHSYECYINGEYGKAQIPEFREPSGENNISYPVQQGSQGREKFGVFGERGERWDKLTAGRFCNFGKISKVEPVVCGGVNGVPDYAHRLKALGNAVVPQIPEIIGRAIMEIESD